MNYPLVRAIFITASVGLAHECIAQTIDTVGTRPAGMAGAFVAVADDASAVYWNPGALATGSFFSLVLDRTTGRTATTEPAAGSRSGFLIALAAPALGLSYYRLRATTLTPPGLATGVAQRGRNVLGPEEVRLDSLVTHHVGATIVQSVTDRIAVGATLKVVRGTAASAVVRDANRDVLLADSVDVRGRSNGRFDVDLGILATSGPLRAGLTVRNVSEPEFPSDEAEHALRLRRQVRAGVAFQVSRGWILATDLDLRETPGPFGDTRDLAFGGEGRVARRAVVRGGVRFNTAGGSLGRAPSFGLGGSYAVRASVLVDAHVTAGSKRSSRGWGIAGRFVY